MKPRVGLALLLGLALGSPSTLAYSASTTIGHSDAASSVVHAEDHDAFWLWAGVRPQPALRRAKTVYLLQAAVEGGDSPRLVSQRSATPRLRDVDVWMVYRVETLQWSPGIHAALLSHLRRWRAAGNRVIGVQIDFDARTRHLDQYAAFLRDLRRRLPSDTRLGITGLLDWSANGDPAGLQALSGVVDEVVLQIYQGRRVIPGYAGYLSRLDRLAIPFRIGVLQGGEWAPPEALLHHPCYRGVVVFLVNR